jgi:hypothetical protein
MASLQRGRQAFRDRRPTRALITPAAAEEFGADNGGTRVGGAKGSLDFGLPFFRGFDVVVGDKGGHWVSRD